MVPPAKKQPRVYQSGDDIILMRNLWSLEFFSSDFSTAKKKVDDWGHQFSLVLGGYRYNHFSGIVYWDGHLREEMKLDEIVSIWNVMDLELMFFFL